MKLPRYTVRCLMLAVAVAAVGTSTLLSIRSRERGYHARVLLHRSHAARLIRQHHPRDPILQQRRVEYHLKLSEKYERAAERPWLRVDPDPPEPK